MNLKDRSDLLDKQYKGICMFCGKDIPKYPGKYPKKCPYCLMPLMIDKPSLVSTINRVIEDVTTSDSVATKIDYNIGETKKCKYCNKDIPVNSEVCPYCNKSLVESIINPKAHLTAISRTSMSVPMRLLTPIILKHTLKLDYGCGKGYDADRLNMDKYDPHFFPIKPTKQYELITCNYVLNVVDELEENKILANIKKLLMSGGKAYITVRRDIENEGFTKKGTYQRNVILNLPIYIEKKNKLCIYIMRG